MIVSPRKSLSRWATDTADVLRASLVPNDPLEQVHGAADGLPNLNQGLWPRMPLQRHSVAAKKLSHAFEHRCLTTVDHRYSQAGTTALGAVVRMVRSLKVPEAYAESIIGFDR